jgi:hypothetical protein
MTENMNDSCEWYTNSFKKIIESPTGKIGKIDFELTKDSISNSQFFVSLTIAYPWIINNRNVVCYSNEAKLIWQVEDIPETSYSKFCRYEKFMGFADNESVVMAFNWNHWVVGIDIQTGSIVKKTNSLPDWKVDDNIVVCPNNKVIALPFEVMTYDKVGEDLLVLVEPPHNVLMPNNVFMISRDGFIKWQIEKNGKTDRDVAGFYNAYDLPPKNGQLHMFTVSGFIIDADIDTGKITNIHWSK